MNLNSCEFPKSFTFFSIKLLCTSKVKISVQCRNCSYCDTLTIFNQVMYGMVFFITFMWKWLYFSTFVWQLEMHYFADSHFLFNMTKKLKILNMESFRSLNLTSFSHFPSILVPVLFSFLIFLSSPYPLCAFFPSLLFSFLLNWSDMVVPKTQDSTFTTDTILFTTSILYDYFLKLLILNNSIKFYLSKMQRRSLICISFLFFTFTLVREKYNKSKTEDCITLFFFVKLTTYCCPWQDSHLYFLLYTGLQLERNDQQITTETIFVVKLCFFIHNNIYSNNVKS